MKKLILVLCLFLSAAYAAPQAATAGDGLWAIKVEVIELSPGGVGAIVSTTDAPGGYREMIVTNMKGFVVGDRVILSGKPGEPATLNGKQLRSFAVVKILQRLQ